MPEHGAISKPEILNVVGLSSEVCSKHKAQKYAYLRVCARVRICVCHVHTKNKGQEPSETRPV